MDKNKKEFKFKNKGKELFAEIPCKECGNIMKLKGYNDSAFFKTINEKPTKITCVNCNEPHDIQWQLTHIDVFNYE